MYGSAECTRRGAAVARWGLLLLLLLLDYVAATALQNLWLRVVLLLLDQVLLIMLDHAGAASVAAIDSESEASLSDILHHCVLATAFAAAALPPPAAASGAVLVRVAASHAALLPLSDIHIARGAAAEWSLGGLLLLLLDNLAAAGHRRYQGPFCGNVPQHALGFAKEHHRLPRKWWPMSRLPIAGRSSSNRR